MTEDKGTSSGAPTTCPRCGSGKILPILYGLPDEEGFRDSAEGRIHLGGCIVSEDNPVWHCDACGFEGGRFGDVYPHAVEDED